jgi:hypothetical protein
MLDADQLEELHFEMRQSGGGQANAEYMKLLGAMRCSQRLKRLVITVALKSELIDMLNKNIGKDAGLRAL